MLRVKDEARWIERVIKSIQPVCDDIFVLDDHSTDGTPDICEALGCWVIDSDFDSIHEGRDKDVLLKSVWRAGAKVGDHCLMIDGDEALHQDDIPALKQAVDQGVACGNMHIVYLWDREDQVRVDRWYREFRRPSLFRLTSKDLSFQRTGFGGNFHCSSAPAALLGQQTKLAVRLLHFGYLHREDRVRKYHWYNEVDPNNAIEDGYKHVVIGDLFPATAAFRWAGPLELKPL
jgi:glycosyltransferase involved in cell wall biosynthesis